MEATRYSFTTQQKWGNRAHRLVLYSGAHWGNGGHQVLLYSWAQWGNRAHQLVLYSGAHWGNGGHQLLLYSWAQWGHHSFTAEPTGAIQPNSYSLATPLQRNLLGQLRSPAIPLQLSTMGPPSTPLQLSLLGQCSPPATPLLLLYSGAHWGHKLLRYS